MTDTIRIRVEGLDKVIGNVEGVGHDLPRYTRGAGIEISREILGTRGLQNYPPETTANQPPPPFYIRGRGMQTSASRNDGSSERLGTRWETIPRGQMGTEIRNLASYAEHVHGQRQARHMGAKGWRILVEVAKEKTGTIVEIYNRWVDRLLRSHGLK